MKRARVLLYLLLLAGCESPTEVAVVEKTCIRMTLSDALPIQFTLAGEASFNNKPEAGVDEHCFKQPFNCDDEIKIQLPEDAMVTKIFSNPNLWTDIAPYSIQFKTEAMFSSYQFSGAAVTRKAYQPLAVAAGETIKFKVFASFFTGVTSLIFTLTDGADADTSVPVTITSYDNGIHEIELTATSASTRLRLAADMASGANRWALILVPDVKDYSLLIKDEDGEELTTLPFTRTPAEETLTANTAALAAAATSNANGGVTNWVGGNLTLSFGSAGTKKSYLKVIPLPVAVEGQRVRVFIEANGSRTGSIDLSEFTIDLLDAAYAHIKSFTFSVPVASWGLTGWVEIDATALADIKYIGLYSYSEASGAGAALTFLDYMIATYNMYPETAVFDVSLIPDDNDLCNSLVTLEILNEDSVMVAYSDFIDIRTDHKDTRLLSYSNKVDYAGLKYTGIEPTPSFNYRVKSKFAKERRPEQNESHRLSNNTINKLMSTVTRQKLLQVDPLPAQEHLRILLILQHNTVFIGNKAYVKEEDYTTEELNERYPFQTGQGWLTYKD